MELRLYWRMLMRRRRVVLNTFLVVALVSLALVAWGYYGSAFKAKATVFFQVQLDPHHPVQSFQDPVTVASNQTDQVVDAVDAYATSQTFFVHVQNALKAKGYNVDWKAIGASIDIENGHAHDVTVSWSSSDEGLARTLVQVARSDLEYVATHLYRNKVLLNTQPVTATEIQLYSQRVSFTKPLGDLGLRLVLGLFAGVILAYMFEYLDTRLQDEYDARHWLGVPTLGEIPAAPTTRRARSA